MKRILCLLLVVTMLLIEIHSFPVDVNDFLDIRRLCQDQILMGVGGRVPSIRDTHGFHLVCFRNPAFNIQGIPESQGQTQAEYVGVEERKEV